MVGEAWEGSGRILWKFWRKARSQSGQNFIFFGNSRIPYPDGNQIFKINAVILSQIVLILEKKITKNRPDMEVRTIFSGKSRGGQVQSGQISGAAVRTKVFRIRPPLPLPGVLVTLRNSWNILIVISIRSVPDASYGLSHSQALRVTGIPWVCKWKPNALDAQRRQLVVQQWFLECEERKSGSFDLLPVPVSSRSMVWYLQDL